MNPTAAILFALLAAYVEAAVQVRTKESPASEALKKKIHDQCMNETKATPEQAKILYNFKDVPKDDTEKCFLECIYKMSGGIGADGKYSTEGFDKLIDLKYKGDENVGAKKINSDCAKKVATKEGEKCSLGRSIRECMAAAAQEVDYFSI